MASGQGDFPFHIRDVVELLHLRVRRPSGNSVYVDCPFCGDQRGKMNVNFDKDAWRCNYCGEGGGMLALYGKYYHISNSEAYREICDALMEGITNADYTVPSASSETTKEEAPQSMRASNQEIHQTYSLLLGMLTLSEKHRRHLTSPKRGLNDEQIQQLGYKSTPPPCLCLSLTERLLQMGCTVAGVPGFYQREDGKWTVKFHKRTAGILLPAKGLDGLIRGMQILLDEPIKDKDDPPDKTGTKYLWLSSAGKNGGVTSGSPTHFVGNPFARTVYVTEGILKADIAHLLMNRTFVAIAGANNVSQLDIMFSLLAQNGTELIVEAHDMDKYRNEMIVKGASKIYLMAREKGLDCRRLTWNPNYKGIDDWQLSLRRNLQEKEGSTLNFKERYLLGLCSIETVDGYIQAWHEHPLEGRFLPEYLGLTESEYELFTKNGSKALEECLNTERKCQKFRIYQLYFDADTQTKPFAFCGIEELHKAGYEQPPAADYSLVCEGYLWCPKDDSETAVLEHIYNRYNGNLPADYRGRNLSPSDVVELFDNEKRRYFYRSKQEFISVRFSPFLVRKPEQKP